MQIEIGSSMVLMAWSPYTEYAMGEQFKYPETNCTYKEGEGDFIH